MSNTLTTENTIVTIEPRKIKAGTSEERIVYDAVDPKGDKWTIWERETAEQAWALKGTPSLWQVTVETNGKYTNRNLKAITAKPTSGFEPALGAMEAALGSGSPTSPLDSLPETRKSLVEDPSYRDRSIFRQTAAKVAGALANERTTPLEFWTNVEMLATYFETGEPPYLNGVDIRPTGDDDIPF